MSETKQPYKWYWAYTPGNLNGITLFFDTLDEARDHAIANGEFDEICGKDNFMAHDENLFFEVCEDDLHEYSPAERGR